MNIYELKEKPIGQMTGEAFLFPENGGLTAEYSGKKYVYGISGIAQLFGCGMPTADRIKKKRQNRQCRYPSRAKNRCQCRACIGIGGTQYRRER
jgi:hypothetical protein